MRTLSVFASTLVGVNLAWIVGELGKDHSLSGLLAFCSIIASLPGVALTVIDLCEEF